MTHLIQKVVMVVFGAAVVASTWADGASVVVSDGTNFTSACVSYSDGAATADVAIKAWPGTGAAFKTYSSATLPFTTEGDLLPGVRYVFETTIGETVYTNEYATAVNEDWFSYIAGTPSTEVGGTYSDGTFTVSDTTKGADKYVTLTSVIPLTGGAETDDVLDELPATFLSTLTVLIDSDDALQWAMVNPADRTKVLILTGPTLSVDTDYSVKAEVDIPRQKVRFSVAVAGSSDYTVLSQGTTTWFDFASAGTTVSAIQTCFVEPTSLSGVYPEGSVAMVGSTGYASLDAAAAAASALSPAVLRTNVTWPEAKVGTYYITFNDKTVTRLPAHLQLNGSNVERDGTACAFTWVGEATGAWATFANWSPNLGVAPGGVAADTVAFGDSDYTIDVADGASVSVLTLAGGSFTKTGAGTLTAETLTGGDLFVTAGAFAGTSVSNVALSATGSLANSGDTPLTINGRLHVEGSVVDFPNVAFGPAASVLYAMASASAPMTFSGLSFVAAADDPEVALILSNTVDLAANTDVITWTPVSLNDRSFALQRLNATVGTSELEGTIANNKLTLQAKEGGGTYWHVSDGDTTKPAPAIAIDSAWAAKNIPTGETADQQSYLVTKNSNGVAPWQAYALGFEEKTDVDNAAVFTEPIQNAESGELNIKMNVVRDNLREGTGAKVTYTLVTKDSPSDAGTETPSDDGSAVITLPTDGKVHYYQMKMDISMPQ